MGDSNGLHAASRISNIKRACDGKAAQSILFQMTGADPAVLALSAVVLALVALSAGFIPAHRASRVDPMRALKYE